MAVTQPPDQVGADIKYRLQTEFAGKPGMIRAESVVVKEGPRVWKSASILLYGDTKTGEIKRRELRFKTWRPQQGLVQDDE
jgi:hypothetical protein